MYLCIASHAVVFRGLVLLRGSNTSPLKTTAWEATLCRTMPSILRPYLGQRTTSKEVILSICSYVTRLIKLKSGLELKILKKIVLISSPENDLMLTDDLLNKYR